MKIVNFGTELEFEVNSNINSSHVSKGFEFGGFLIRFLLSVAGDLVVSV